MTTLAICSNKPVLHVVVVGFHHKKGCQVEYAYPPLVAGGEVNSNKAPEEWKHLPSLAIPDGAHNYTSDSIYFHLPAREGLNRTVYGVACYRQIEAKDLKIKTDDITRSTVQKSVVVLSYLPLYGLIEAKLELITHAYFKELDFSQVSLLEETYNNLNASLTASLLDGGSQVYLGMNVKELVQCFRHKIVMIFKLMLLERRVLFTGAPVEKLGNSLLSVLSLYPGMIEHGLVECTTYGVHRHISPTITNTRIGSDSEAEEFLEIRYSDEQKPEVTASSPDSGSKTSSSSSKIAVEPASPTMDRGLDKLIFPDTPVLDMPTDNINSSQTNNNHTTLDKNKKTPQPKLQIHSSGKTKTGSKESLHDSVKSKSNSSLSSIKSDSNSSVERASVHAVSPKLSEDSLLDYVDDYYTRDSNPGSERSFMRGGESSDDVIHQQVLLPADSDILTGVTEYQAVQAGVSIPKNGSVINIEEFSEHSLELEEDYFSSMKVTTETSRNPKRSRSSEKEVEGETVEELDSPESISQIDQEDCFSWEDRMSLSINTDKPASLDPSAGLASSFKDVGTLERALSVGSTHSGAGDTGNSAGENVQGTQEVPGQTAGRQEEITKTDGNTVSTPGSNGLSQGIKAAAIKSKLTNAFTGLNFKGRLSRSKPGSRETSEPPSPASTQLPPLPGLYHDNVGFPLAIFTKGSVCFPYLSLQYYDLLNDVNVRSFVIGATNMLFRQKRHLTDVIVDVDENKVEIHERELQKQLVLTTADLRFAEILVKAVTGITDDGYFEGTEWEGNDEWLRAQFKLYLEGMLAAVHTEDAKLQEDYGVTFIQCWKTTHNYKVWTSCERPALSNLQPGHPCQGNLSVTDIRMRLSHTMHNTEGGKKINAAVSQTGKYVVQTGKAVGGALTQAKSSLSSWFSTWKSSDKPSSQEKSSPEKSSGQSTDSGQLVASEPSEMKDDHF